MNILQVNTHDYRGGAAKVAYSLHHYLNKNRVKSSFLTSKKTLKDSKVHELKRGVTSKIVNFFAGKIGIGDYFPSNKNYFKNNKLINSADIIHLHNLHGNYFSIFDLALLAKQKPIVWTLHDMWPVTGHCTYSYECSKWQNGCGHCPHLETYPRLLFDISAQLLKQKSNIYANTKFTITTPSKWLKNIVEKSILSSQRVELIYNGIDEAIFKPRNKGTLRKKLGLPQNKIIISFVSENGRKITRKGSHFLDEVVERYKECNNIFFLEIGSESKWQPSNRNFLRIPYVNDESLLAQYYSSSDIFLFTSIAENCPLTVLEAMGSGLPVIAFDVGGTGELIQDTKTGYLVKTGDAEKMIGKLKLLIRNEKLLKENGRRARKRVEKYFTLKKQAQSFIDLYKDLLK